MSEGRDETKHLPPRTTGCWAWQTVPVSPAFCTCVGCTRWRASAAESGSPGAPDV